MSVTVVTQVQRVVVRGSGASYSDARVLAYLRSILTANNDLLTVANGVLARIGVGSAPTGAVLTWNGSAWTVAAPATPTVSWSDITGKPSTFAPSSHTHVASEITDFATAWTARLTAAGSGATTGSALIWGGSSWAPGAYAYGNLSGVPATFAPSSHTHTASEVSDFSTAWTTRMTALGSGANPNDVLTWNGSAWAAAAPSGGGMSNPMTTAWDLIRGGASGTPTRLAVGSTFFDVLATKADGTFAWCPQVAGFGRMPARYSLAIADGNGTPVMFGWTTAVTRVQTSSSNGVRVSRTGGGALHRQSTSTAANQWAGWTLATSVSSTIAPYGSSSAILRGDESSGSAYAYGLIVGAAALNGSTGPYFNAAPTTFACYGLRWRPATQTTWHLIMYDGSTFTETDTGVTVTGNSSGAATDGTTHGLVVGRDPSGVWWEIWNELTSPPTLLGSGRTNANVPTTFANILSVYSGFGSNGASANGQTNMLGFTTLTVGGPF